MKEIKYPLTEESLNEALQYSPEATVWRGLTASILWLAQTIEKLSRKDIK